MQENGLNIIISLVLNDIKPLADDHMELALEIKVISLLSLFFFCCFTSVHQTESSIKVASRHYGIST